MKKHFVAAALVAAFAVPSFAKVLHGVTLPDTTTVDGKTLKLNGLGLLKKLIFKVYVAGLYLETPSSDPGAILAADSARRVEMQMLRNLDKGKITEAIEKGFEKNAKDKLPALKARLDQLMGLITDFKEGEHFVVTYS